MYEYNQYYGNQMYSQPSMPMQNQRMQFLQQQQNALQGQMQPQYLQQTAIANPQSIIGRFVNDFAEIRAEDVPMSGVPAVFIKNDLSEIQTRAWSADGKIVSVSFKPNLEPKANNSSLIPSEMKIGLSDEVTEAFMKRFDDIENRFLELEKSMTNSKAKVTTSKAKKEAVADE